jgi:hypothetical protein
MMAEVKVSAHRYNHYVTEPDRIKQVEISKYNKDWMSNSLKLLDPEMMKTHSEELRVLFQEILLVY